jgi:hypothetical protein
LKVVGEQFGAANVPGAADARRRDSAEAAMAQPAPKRTARNALVRSELFERCLEELTMSRGLPSMTALLGMLAMAGYRSDTN